MFPILLEAQREKPSETRVVMDWNCGSKEKPGMLVVSKKGELAPLRKIWRPNGLCVTETVY